MGDAAANHEHECRHCSGLCAGRSSKCPYCKRWLRREDAVVASGRPDPGDRATRRD